MEDGQDHQEGGEIEAGLASTPSAGLPMEPTEEVAVETVAPDGVVPVDLDEMGLTGVLAALEYPDPEESGAVAEPEAADAASVQSAPGATDAELVALQAELEADETAPEVAASVAVPVAETMAEAAPAGAPETTPGAAPIAVVEPVAATETAPVAGAPASAEGAAQVSADAGAMAFPDDRRGVPIWPFLVYFVLWIAFAGLLVWQFAQTPAGVPLYELSLYGPSILAGLVLTALGPVLAIGVWFVVWMARPGARAGLFSRSLIIGAVVTLAGVALWLVALGAVDMLRLGRLI